MKLWMNPTYCKCHSPLNVSNCNFYRAMLRRVQLCHSMSSVRPSVLFTYRDHTGWNTSKIISRLNSLKYLLTLTPTSTICSNGNTPKIRVEYGWGHSERKKSAISPKRCKIWQSYYDGLIGSRIHAFDRYQINDLGWPWTAETHSCGKNRFTEPTRKI